jgi:hypothetical protein
VPRILSYQSPSATNNFAPTKYVQIDQTVEGKVAHRRFGWVSLPAAKIIRKR